VDNDGDGFTDIIATDQGSFVEGGAYDVYLYHNDSVRGSTDPADIHFTRGAQPLLKVQPDPNPPQPNSGPGVFISRPYLADTDGDGLLDLLQGHGVWSESQKKFTGYQW